MFKFQKIVSGGQTGVDRAALDAAQDAGLAVGGWCPRGRRAEDGPIPTHYPLQETPLRKYAQRTAWNVRDSDATLILTMSAPTGGTALTQQEARKQRKPFDSVQLGREAYTGDRPEIALPDDVRILNVAGPRASEERGIYEGAFNFLRSLFS